MPDPSQPPKFQGMDSLVQGLRRFRTEVHENQREFFKSLIQGQDPDFLFITCCDSRVQPDVILQSKPGDMFILRNIGNIVPPHGTENSVQAAVEYSVKVLGVKHIIVCGHSHCGAMGGVLKPESLAGLPAVADWLRYADATRQIVEENYGHLEGEEKLNAAIEVNVLVQLENLKTLPVVAPRLMRNELSLHGWVYRFETGEVAAFDPEANGFVAVEKAHLPSVRPVMTAPAPGA
jgi:carbonic anhydrase